MKITDEHYDYLYAAIKQLDSKLATHKEYLIKEGKCKDIDKRLRWDALYASVSSKWICDHLYTYLNDVHIDTALRHIMQDLNA